MFWGAISSNVCIELQIPSTRLKSTKYITVLGYNLLPFLRENNEKICLPTEQYQNSCQQIEYRMFRNKSIEVLQWPSFEKKGK